MKVVILLLSSLLLTCGAAGAEDLPTPPRDDLVLWLRADAGVQSDGDRVTNWRDQSGNDNHASAKLPHAPQLVERGMGERPALRFDGQSTFLTIPHSPELNAGDGFTIIAAYSFTGGFRIAQKKDNSGGIVPDGWFLTTRQGAGISGEFLNAAPFREGRPHVQANVFDGENRTLKILDFGHAIDTIEGVPPQQPNTDPLRIGKRHNPAGAEGHMEGLLAELLIYDVALSDTVRKQVEEYLTAKYDIAAPVEPSINITRVIPVPHRITIDWQGPQVDAPAEYLEYELQVKLRDAPWSDAAPTTIPFGRRSASASGLLNHADYALRLNLRDTRSQELIGHSATRLVTCAEIPGTVIDYLHRDDQAYWLCGQYVGSPSMARMPDGRLVAAHDLFGPGPQDHTRVFISEDDGNTWRHAAEVDESFWGKLFTHRGRLYLITCRSHYDDILLYHSPDGGHTWTDPALIAPGTYHKAPVPVKVHNGRIWTCVELQTGGWPEGFQAVTLSAPADADLMNPDNWTVSEPLPYDTNWLPDGLEVEVNDQGYLEGNIVIAPDGQLLNILRYNTPPYYGKAVVLRIDPDGARLRFDRVINLPGGMKKFTIRRDPDTGLYWSLVNRVTRPNACGMRSVLSLICSDDLDNWHVVKDILRDDRQFAVRYTGFQYVDWLFDGDDIIAVVRMGFNGAHNFHDANHMTFHRIRNYAADLPDTIRDRP